MTAGAAFILGAGAVAGCSASSAHQPTRADMEAATAYQSPLQATLSWFFAVNHKDKAAAVAHFAPAERGQMDWGGGDTSTWSTFSALRCRQLSGDASGAEILCTFKETPGSYAGQVDDFWTISLSRQLDGRWLITNYGQG